MIYIASLRAQAYFEMIDFKLNWCHFKISMRSRVVNITNIVLSIIRKYVVYISIVGKKKP